MSQIDRPWNLYTDMTAADAHKRKNKLLGSQASRMPSGNYTFYGVRSKT